MPSCTLVVRDQVNCAFVGLDPLIRRQFVAALKFLDPKARHTPAFKLGRWDGKIAFGTVGGSTYLNLLDRVLPLIEQAGYSIALDDRRPVHQFSFPAVTHDIVADRTWAAGHPKAGEPIMLRDHQVEAIQRYFDNPQSIQEIATGAGKTVLCAVMSLCVEKYGRSLIIVPSKSLVVQTEEDYRNLGLDVGVYYGDRKEWQHQHVIATWQSLAVYAKSTTLGDADVPIEDFLDNVVCVINDEVHAAKAAVLRGLLCGALATIPLRWGMTGTVPKEDYEFMSLLAGIGPVVGRIAAAELQQLGILANCAVDILQLDDSHVEFKDYDSEYRFLTTDPERLNFIAGECRKLAADGNTVVLVDRVKTGQALADLLPGAVFISGKMKVKTRASKYKEMQSEDGKLFIATYGVASVGININRIFHLAIFEPGKAYTRVMQSLGRGLRVANDKDFVGITEFTSNLRFVKRHLIKRKEYYDKANFCHKVRKVCYHAETSMEPPDDRRRTKPAAAPRP